MSDKNHSLRVALVFRGTVHQEETFTRTSDPVVTVGDSEEATFVTPADALPAKFEMFEREDEGYLVRFTEEVEGSLTVDEEEKSLQQIVDDDEAVAVDSVATGAGTTSVYEVKMDEGDWGLLKLGELEIFFQLLGEPEAIAGRGQDFFDWPVLGMVGIAAVLHIAFLLVAFLAFDVDAELKQRKISDRFVKLMVDDVEDPLEEEKKEEPEEDTTGKKAGGKEGKFGKEDADVEESKVPKQDGPMKKKIDVKNLGVNKMLASKNLGSGALKNIFGNQDGFDSKMKVAMSGSGSDLQVGRGAGGMGLRGTGSGGGGEGFGRVQGLGKVDTGGGKGTGAKLGSKEKKKVEPKMSRGSPKVGDFCDSQNIRNVVKKQNASIQYCYERQLQTNPELSGKVVAQWKVDLDGSVKSASIANSTINDQKVESCITRVIKRMRFDEPDGGLCIINFPFVFTGGG